MLAIDGRAERVIQSCAGAGECTALRTQTTGTARPRRNGGCFGGYAANPPARACQNKTLPVARSRVHGLAALTPLAARLDTLLKSYGPCRFLTQDIVTASSNLDVRVSGQLIAEWHMDKPGVLTLTGAACETVAADDNAFIEIRPKPQRPNE